MHRKPFSNSFAFYRLLGIVGIVLLLFLYIIDSNENIFAAPDSEVTFTKKWGGTCLLKSDFPCGQDQQVSENMGDGKFWGLWGIASDESAVYAVDVLNNRVQKFDNNGDFIKNWGSGGVNNGQFDNPSGIAADLQNVYVADYGNRIQVFNKDGDFIKVIGESGTAAGQLDHPEDIDVDVNGRIYVADSGNNRIQIFNPDNTVITWGTQGTSQGQFDYPQGVAVPAPGHVYVADSHNDRVQYFQLASVCPPEAKKVAPEVCFVREWGKPGTAEGQFQRPADIDVSDSIVYVVDGNNNRIQMFTPDGIFIKKFGSECLIKTGLQTSDDCKDPDEDGPLETGDGQFKYPAGITVYSNTIFVADNFNDRVQVFHVEPGQILNGPNLEKLNLPEQENKKPIADAGNDKSVFESKSVSLDGGGSKDSDGTIASYNWKLSGCSNNEPKGTLKNSDSAVATFVAPQISGSSATCTIGLEVTDDKGLTDTDLVEIKVSELSSSTDLSTSKIKKGFNVNP